MPHSLTIIREKKSTMYKILGGCHCGNISYVAKMPNEPSTYNPRSCDCQFCTILGASYLSDSNGTLIIKIKSKDRVSKNRQGSRIADFLSCKNCGFMTNVCYEENDCVYGSINVRSAEDFAKFGKGHVTHLVELSDKERINRWKNIWFSNVKIEYESAYK